MCVCVCVCVCWLLKNELCRKKEKIIDLMLKIEKESINNFVKEKHSKEKKMVVN